MAGDEEAPAEVADEVQAPAEGEEDVVQLGDGEEGAQPPPPAPKKKPTYFVHWDRKKPRFYDYNFDYGSNYYSNVVNYVSSKDLASRCSVPRRQPWAERAISSSLHRKNLPDVRTQDILTNVRTSIRDYQTTHRSYVSPKSYFAGI